MKNALAIAVVTAAALSTVALANQPGGMTQDSTAIDTHQTGNMQAGTGAHDMTGIDLNEDQRVTREEAIVVPGLVERWDELDSNADGQLDESEFARFENDQAIEGTLEGIEGLQDPALDDSGEPLKTE